MSQIGKQIGGFLVASGLLVASPLVGASPVASTANLFDGLIQTYGNDGYVTGETSVGDLLGADLGGGGGVPGLDVTDGGTPSEIGYDGDYRGVDWLPTHTVVKGDTLWAIAQKHCGDGNQWRHIFQANRYKIRDPHWIYPGQNFQIACSAGQSYGTESGKPWYETDQGREVVDRAGGGESEFITHMPLPRGSFRISSDFGPRTPPKTATGHGSSDHKGIDLAAPSGTPVGAVGPGVVLRSGWNGGYGEFLEIQHPDGMITRYGHLKSGSRLVKKGDRVEAGQQIARVGTTGNSQGPHLHFETRRPNMVAVDPAPFIGLA